MTTVITLLLEDDDPLGMLRKGRYTEVGRTRRGKVRIPPTPEEQDRRITELEGKLAVALGALLEIRKEAKPPVSVIATFALAKVQED